MKTLTAVLIVAYFDLSFADPAKICYHEKSCCDVSGFHDKDALGKCMKKLNITGSPNRDHQIKCVAQCMGNEQGYMDNNGLVDMEKYRIYIEKSLASLDSLRWMTPTDIKGMIDVCAGRAPSRLVEPTKCNDFAMTMGHCLIPEIQKLCPADKQQNVEKCAVLKTYIQEQNKLPPAHLRC